MSVKAYYGTVLVAEMDSVRESGLVLPPEAHGTMPNRGIVQSAGPDVDHLEPGTVVYYCDHQHPQIGDAKVIGAACVMAYEELES